MRLDRIRVIYWRAGNGCEGLWWSRVNRNVWGFQDTENGDGAPSTSPCLPGWVVAEVLFASLGMMWTWMVGMENHRLLLFKPSNCFVARIFPFKRDDLYLVGWLQKKGMLVCVWVSGRWELLEIPFFYPVTTDVNCLLNGKIHPKLTQSSCQNVVFPSSGFHRGILSNIAGFFERGRKSNQRWKHQKPNPNTSLVPPAVLLLSQICIQRLLQRNHPSANPGDQLLAITGLGWKGPGRKMPLARIFSLSFALNVISRTTAFFLNDWFSFF